MKKKSLKTIIGFSLSKQTLVERALYLVRGLAFAPWLVEGFAGAPSDQTAADTGQAGDDIYPLF